MAVSTGDMKAGIGMDIGMHEILIAALDLEACIYNLL